MLSRHGLDWLAHSRSPLRYFALPSQWLKKDRHEHRSQAERARLALEELGTTYIKLGQALSTRTDIIPPEYVRELSKLQDDAPTIPYEQVCQVVCEELGDRPELVFASFEREPMAAASIGQVHRAVLDNGTAVVVKIQRPGVQEKVEEDLEVLAEIGRFLTDNTEIGRRYDIIGWLKEFAFTLRNELDYRREGRNADTFRFNFLEDESIRVPRVFWELTTRRVITMEQVEGIKITDFDALEAAGVDRTLIAQTASRFVLTEVFDHGFFHADPHPGNFFVFPDSSIAIIDMGMVGHLDRKNRESLMRVTLNLAKRNADALVEELLILGFSKGLVRRQELKIDLDRLIQLYMDGSPDQFSLAQMFNDTLSTAARHNIQVPSDLLFLAKTIAMCEGLATMLDPGFRLMDFARAYLEERYREIQTREAILERTKENAGEIADLVVDLPLRSRRLLGQLERGEIGFVARLENLDQMLRTIRKSANRLSMSVLIAGLIAGFSVLTLTLRPSQRDGLASNMLVIMLLLMLGFGMYYMISMLQSKRTEEL